MTTPCRCPNGTGSQDTMIDREVFADALRLRGGLSGTMTKKIKWLNSRILKRTQISKRFTHHLHLSLHQDNCWNSQCRYSWAPKLGYEHSTTCICAVHQSSQMLYFGYIWWSESLDSLYRWVLLDNQWYLQRGCHSRLLRSTLNLCYMHWCF